MTDVGSPVAGRVLPLASVPDPVFAGGMVGPGAAVDPDRSAGEAVSPVDGRIVKLHPHAFVVVDDAGHGVLVHLGIDTVEMKGDGFRVIAAEGDEVRAGQPVVSWDPAAVEATGRSPICPIVALDAGPEALAGVIDAGSVAAGDRLFSWQ